MERKFSVIFLGTGVSTAIPNISHVINEDAANSCQVCHHATSVKNSKNKRNNVSIAIKFKSGSEVKCLMIDAGKTMRDSCLAQFPKYGINEVHGIILTHGHADAILGLDDVRDLQKYEIIDAIDTEHLHGTVHKGFKISSGALPIYLTAETFSVVKKTFSYLVKEPEFFDKENQILQRRVAFLDFEVINPTDEIFFHDLKIKCFPVWHGGKYVSLGFSIGNEGEFVYISDIKTFPKESMEFLKNIPQIKVLVIDSLDRHGIWSHLGLSESIEVIKMLQPKKAFLTGMSCGMGLHDDVVKEIQANYPNIDLAYDGLHLDDFKF